MIVGSMNPTDSWVVLLVVVVASAAVFALPPLPFPPQIDNAPDIPRLLALLFCLGGRRYMYLCVCVRMYV